ncbi:MAG TPA: 3-phosphoglycerate dehydrogenase [Blastocatellia bacterium]|nr:3-phosphoglycerate dehydrogenase [Blastocatellia bacterium]
MKVLIADKFPDGGQQALKEMGVEIVYDPELKDAALVEAIRSSGADVLVVRSTKVNKEMLEAGRLSLVIRAGAGYNTIDVQTASARGIYVSNCPGKNSIAVAELAFGLILALDRRIPENVADLKQGRWNKKEYSKARGLYGRVLGIVGAGQIGCEMITRARAFGMPVVAWSRSLSPERAAALGVEMKQSPVEVAAAASIVSLHLALKDETRTLIDDRFFEAMQPGSFLINTSRAEVVDQAALERAVREKGIRAGLDVFAGEPAGGTGSVEDEIFKLDGVIGTHHIGASTDQAQAAIADETVRIIRVYKETGRAPNVVNLAKKSPATHLLVVRHFDRVGVLADVFDQIKAAGINVQETENIVFDGAVAAVARIHLDQALPGETVQAIISRSNDIIEASLLKL